MGSNQIVNSKFKHKYIILGQGASKLSNGPDSKYFWLPGHMVSVEATQL